MSKQNKKTIITDGTQSKIEVSVDVKPAGRRGRRPKIDVFSADDIAREQLGGFVAFLREHAIVGLAVGFIIGQQAQVLVKQLVDSFITPLLSLWIGQDLMNKQFIIGGHGNTPFTWGKFVYVLVNFMFVVFFIYVIIKVFNLDKLDKPKSKS